MHLLCEVVTEAKLWITKLLFGSLMLLSVCVVVCIYSTQPGHAFASQKRWNKIMENILLDFYTLKPCGCFNDCLVEAWTSHLQDEPECHESE